jgi:DNA-binding protein Fis
VHNKSLAAKMLGIDRSVLRRKLVRYGLLAEDEE